jgi:hypothetical protein
MRKHKPDKIVYTTTRVNGEGRVLVRLCPGCWIMRSRVNYCNAKGLALKDIEGLVIHHDNEDVADDKPDNLEAYTNSDHYKLHWARYSAKKEIRNLDDIRELCY